MARCGWCGTHNPDGKTNCINCGGPLPKPPGPELGEPPPPAPRIIPVRYSMQKLYTRNFGCWFGGIWAAVGGLIMVVFTVLGVVLLPMLGGACLGSIFFLVGAVVAVVAFRSAARHLAVQRRGLAAEGQVVDVSLSDGLWKVSYVFQVGGASIGGTAMSSDPVTALAKPGDLLWVTYVPNDPERNAPWPPMI